MTPTLRMNHILTLQYSTTDQLLTWRRYSAVPPIVRRLRTRFGKNGDTPDKSTNFFPRALHHHSFHFGRGATSSGMQKAAILDFQYGRHVKSISANISAWKALRRSILVSKYTFSESRNALESLKIALDDYLFRDQINILILAMNSHNFQHRS